MTEKQYNKEMKSKWSYGKTFYYCGMLWTIFGEVMCFSGGTSYYATNGSEYCKIPLNKVDIETLKGV